ncbi:MAG: SH3 domain-containing protein [Oscillospiraceae bacterium]|nr:SH3 domain-containing protein [Oscillospiraceae bacterium]
MATIYLSPSLQPYNLYEGGGNEQQYMNLIADAMEPYLRTNGIQFTRNRLGMTLGQVIRESNSGNYDLHLAIHSNAAPEDLSGQLYGTDVYYYPYSWRGKRAATIIADNFKKIYPDPSRVQARPTTTLAEITKTNAPAVLIEVAYHDNSRDAEWIRTHVDEIAQNLVQSLTMYFGIPFITPPQPERVGIVRTQGGNLNIRRKPTTDSEIIGQIPNGAQVTVFGQTGNWYVVQYGNVTGYVRGDYLEIVS